MGNNRKPKPLAGDQGRATNSDGQATGPSVPQSPSTVNSQNEHFSFRWGIPLLDCGFTIIPNFFYDCYSQAGVTGREFLAIQHLARYQYDSPEGECRPSVATVARQMGYSERGLQKILAGLEERGLLVRHYRTGQTSIYDFSGFSRAMLALSTISQTSITGDGGALPYMVNPSSPGGVNPSSPGGVNPSSPGGVNPSSPEEEKPKKKKQQEERAAAGLPQEGKGTVTCSIHGVPMQQRSKGDSTWYSHRLPDGTWCKGGDGGNGRVTDAHVTDRGRYAEFHLVTVGEE